MEKSKIQAQRDFHFQKQVIDMQIELPLALRNTEKLEQCAKNWGAFGTERWKLFSTITSIDILSITSVAKWDANLTLRFIKQSVSEFRTLAPNDKKALKDNFVPKGMLLHRVYEIMEKAPWQYMSGSDKTNQEIVTFYGASDNDEKTIRIFDPFWSYYYHKFIQPFRQLKIDNTEYLAIFLLIMFDPAYSNLSDQCVNLCENMRKIILRELRGYQLNKKYDETRILAITEAIQLVEKADTKLREEILICDMNGIKFDEEFKRLLFIDNI